MQLPRGEETPNNKIAYIIEGCKGLIKAVSFDDIVFYLTSEFGDNYGNYPKIKILNTDLKGEWMFFDGKYRRVADAQEP